MIKKQETIQQALAAYLPDGDKITAVRQLTAGHSNETYLLEGLNQILRLRPADDPLLDALGLEAQFDIYDTLGNIPQAPPVPAVRNLCRDTAVLGAPFFLMDYIEGTTFSEGSLSDWLRTAPLDHQQTICAELVKTAASVSRLEPLAVAGPVLTPTEECSKFLEIAKASENQPLIDLVASVVAIEPVRSGPPSLIHGDIKLPNTIWHGQTLAALLDWELACNGETLCDLGYFLSVVVGTGDGARAQGLDNGIPSREEAVDVWEQASSRSAKGIEWYETYGAIKSASIMAFGAHLAAAGRSDDPRFIEWNTPPWQALILHIVRTRAERI